MYCQILINLKTKSVSKIKFRQNIFKKKQKKHFYMLASILFIYLEY